MNIGPSNGVAFMLPNVTLPKRYRVGNARRNAEQRHGLKPAISRQDWLESQRFKLSGDVMLSQLVPVRSRSTTFQKIARQKTNVAAQRLLCDCQFRRRDVCSIRRRIWIQDWLLLREVCRANESEIARNDRSGKTATAHGNLLTTTHEIISP